MLLENGKPELGHEGAHVLLVRPEPRRAKIEPPVVFQWGGRGGHHAAAKARSRLEEGDTLSGHGKLPGGGQAGDTATDNGDVGREVNG